MKPRDLVLRGLLYYWRTNAAVVLGVATAVAVLAGALLVGDSVRGSLRDLVLQRIGRTDRAVVSTGFFREALGDELAADGVGRRREPADCRRGHGEQPGQRPPRVARAGLRRGRSVLALSRRRRRARSGGARGARSARRSRRTSAPRPSSVVLVRIERPSAIPIESLHGRKDDAGRTLRLNVRAILGAGESRRVLAAAAAGRRARRVRPAGASAAGSRARRPREHAARRRIDASASDATLEASIRRRFALEDVGLTIRPVGGGTRARRRERRRLHRRRAREGGRRRGGGRGAEDAAGPHLSGQQHAERRSPDPVFAGDGDRSARRSAPRLQTPRAGRHRPIVLNDWAARDLAVKVGDPLSLEYYLWEDPGRLVTRTADFRRRRRRADCRRGGRSRPRAGLSRHHRSGDPRRLGSAVSDRPQPRAPRRRGVLGAIPDDAEGVRAARGRAGAVAIALRRSHVGPPRAGRRRAGERDARDRVAAALRAAIDPLALGLSVRDVRGARPRRVARRHRLRRVLHLLQLLPRRVGAAAGGAVLQARGRAARARGRPAPRGRLLDARASGGCSRPKGSCSRVAGSAIGAAGAVAYAGAMMYGLRTWWVGAVATTSLTLHVSPASLARGRGGRARRGDDLHLVDAARAGEDLRAQPAGGRASGRTGRVVVGRAGQAGQVGPGWAAIALRDSSASR